MRLSEQQFRDLLDRYLNNTASQEERDLLDRFFDSYKGDAHQMDLLTSEALKRELLQSINTRIHPRQPARHSFLRVWLPIAASVSLFVIVYFFIGRDFKFTRTSHKALAQMEEQTSAGQKLSTVLPDGTHVHLNGNSKISFPGSFDGKTREVALDGEAYFEVVKNHKPFIVHTNNIDTEVLGTSFNIKNTKRGDVEITLVEGKVNVVNGSGVSTVLNPNQQATVSYGTSAITTKGVNILRYTSWKDNILYFEETTLADALETLENWYGINLKLANPRLNDCVITAKYEDESLENVLSSLQFLLNLDIERADEMNFTINGKGCK